MRRTRAVVTSVAGAMALALFVSACGSSDSGRTTTVTASPTHLGGGGGTTADVSTPPRSTPPSSTAVSSPPSIKISPSAPVSVSTRPTGGTASDGTGGANGGPTGGGGSGGGGNGTGGAPVTASSGAYTSDEMALDVNTAIQTTNDFWTRHWSDYFTGSYVPPKIFGKYNGMYVSNDSRFPGPTCGGDPPLANNAYYCNPEDYLAWDLVLMDRAYDLGDAFLYYVIAHEWGHAIQNRLNGSLVAVAKELQADCLSAATLYGNVADGTLQLEPGDEAEITNALANVADTTPWANSQSHGSPFERIDWFDAGRKGGVATCLNVQSSTG